MARRILVVMGVLAALATGLVACGDDDDDAGVSASSERASLATSGAAADAGGAFRADAPAPGGDGGTNPGVVSSLDRKIVFNAKVRLETGDVARTFNEVGRLAVLAGGFVEQSSFGGQGEGRAASLTLRVPAERYQQTLADIRALPDVEVRSESAQSEEVTGQYTDLASRLRNLERTESQYLALLEKATTIQDILTLTDRLDGVRLQIEQVQGRLAVLDHMTELATIDVSLAPVPVATVEGKGGPPSIGEAFANAWDTSVEAGRYFAVAGVYLAMAAGWLAIPVAAAAFVASKVLRRRPEASP